MALEVFMEDDGILRIKISGNMDKVTVDNLQREIKPFMEAATPEKPLNNIIFPENIGKISYAARRYFTDLNHNSQYGKVAIVKPPRAFRVLGKFVLKATNRNNIGFFENEAQSISWIKSNI
jgi:hypothetical protein